ncbi:peptidase M16 [Leptolyngbya sp. 'hensonii']|uniref:M16 family metallopeptidase n=1 Tax=Leptolyngbya sp. 'hensonii' TaxID=1922337 RepID=UPI00094F74AA|nr:pitrilysin family protein [Leptolyngbya sp. 'hensonii']OLP18036.1 peptidase M16 [Leptolyngbya sp. 'hensonii']
MTSTLLQTPSLSRLNSPTIHQSASGLTIIAEQIPVEAVNLSLWLGVGSALEPNAINGMAHFLEHMVFKGTARLQSGEFERLVEERGAMTNAATSQDYTHFYITAAPHDFADLAPLQIDVVLNPDIPDAAFERERSVVLEEIRRAEDNPRRRTFQRAVEVAFERSPYRRPVLGPAAVIAQLTPEQMREFHATWYRPPAMTAVAVGNLPVPDLIEIVEEGLDRAQSHQSQRLNLPLPTLELPDNAPEPAFTQVVRQEFVDESLQQARLIMAWRVPGLANLNQTYALDVLASILGYGRTARLVRDLREERGLVSAISASNMTYAQQGTFYISAQLPAENVPAVESAILTHLQTLQTDLVSDLEVSRVQTQVANRFVFGNEMPSDRASLYGYYQTLVADLTPAFHYPAHIQALTATDLQIAAQQHLSPEAYGIVVIKPGTP